MARKRQRSDNQAGTDAQNRFRKRFRRADLRFLVWVMIVLNLVLCWGLLLSPGGLKGYLRKRGEVTRLEQKLELLERQNRARFDEIQRFLQDPGVQEKMVRNHLGWAKPGETVLEFPAHSPAP